MHRLKFSLLTLLIFFSGCIVIPTYTSQITLDQTKVIKEEVLISNLLIVGSGTVASEVFLENLSNEMIQAFKTRGVPSEFSFLGKRLQNESLHFEDLIQDKFDTYLVFKSMDDAYLDMSKEKFLVYSPGLVGTGYGNQYTERFEVTLYHKKEKIKSIWQGNLYVDFDLANNSRYKDISERIFSQLVMNKILLN